MARSSSRSSSSKRSSGKSKRQEPEYGWQNVAVWDSKGGALSGKVRLTPEFLEHVYGLLEDEELELDEDGYLELGIYLREPDSPKRNSPAFFGSIFVPEPQEEEKPSRSRRSSRRRDDDEDEEPVRRRRRV